jgi:hypothetical protein
MIKLPPGWLEGQFDGYIKRGCIIKFHAEELGKLKFAIVLNPVCPEPEILYTFTTSQVAFYDKNQQFEQAIIRVKPGTYACFALPTIIPFREVHAIPLTKLKTQYGAYSLQFCGELNAEHMAQMAAIIKVGLFINPRMQQRLLATPPSAAPSA